MPALSSSYHHDLFERVMDTKNPDTLGNLALASLEMTHSFVFFMQKVVVKYRKENLTFCLHWGCEIEIPRADMNRYYWTVHFIRKLAIQHDPVGADNLFFDKICRRNDLSELNLYSVNASLTIIRSLVSITSRLSIGENMLNEIENLLPRFEILTVMNFFFDCRIPDSFQTHVSMESSNVLEVHTEINPWSEDGILHSFKEEFRHFRTLYVVWCNSKIPIPYAISMLNDSWTFLPNFKNINLYIDCEFHDSLSMLKNVYNLLVVSLCVVPKSIRVRMDMHTCMNGYKLPNKGRITNSTKKLFPPKDFVLTPDRRFSNILNCHKKLNGNVQLEFEVSISHHEYY